MLSELKHLLRGKTLFLFNFNTLILRECILISKHYETKRAATNILVFGVFGYKKKRKNLNFFYTFFRNFRKI